MIDLRRFGLGEVLEASDAEQGFTLFLRHRPEIVISDVRLPGTDGCTMCERIYHESAVTRIIMLSGFNDFEYARRALAYHAVDFLLKPVDQRLLEQVVDQCVRELDKLVPTDNRGRLAVLCTSISNDHGGHGLLNRFVQLVNKRFAPFCDFTVLMVRARDDEQQRVLETLDELCNGQEGFQDSVAFALQGIGVGILLVRRYRLIGLRALATRVLEAVKPVCADPCVAVSDFFANPEEFIHASEQVRELMYLYKPGRRLLLWSETDRGGDIAAFTGYRRGLLEAIKTGNCSRVELLAGELLLRFTASPPRLQLLRVVLTGLIGEISYRFMGKEADSGRLLERVLAVGCALERESLPEGMLRIVTELALEIIAARQLPGNAGDSIADALRYIDENYHRKLTLHQLAADYHMSETYFSALFKKTVGTPLIQHITDLRIMHAKELLLCTDYKVSEIAAMVGYPDQHYFTKVFKRVTGQNPTDFKRRDECGPTKERT